MGRRSVENYKMKAFQEFLNNYLPMDIESKNCAFTWANKRERDEYVKKRLVSTLCATDWCVLFLNSKAYALPAMGSDHNPILLAI